jgi:putative transposase
MVVSLIWLKKKSRILPVSNHSECAAWQGSGKGYGMTKSTKTRAAVQPRCDDLLTEHLRARIAEWLTAILEAEITEVLGAVRYARTGDERRGYRHATRSRTVTTSIGSTTVAVPRGRLFGANGGSEWRSSLLPRYARRTRCVDEGILGTYLAGANTRRLKGALAPLLGDAPLSRSAVSRVMRILREQCEAWRTRPLVDRGILYLFLDAIHVRVRVDRRVQVVPVLVALGVTAAGEKELLALQLVTSESTAAWAALVEDLAGRGLAAPVLCVIDGNAGVRRAVTTTWPKTLVQRCVVHKLRNLEAHAPKRALDELRADYHAITQASSLRVAQDAYRRFIARWQPRSEAVVRSLKEAGEELLTVYSFPRSQWKCLRTTNAIERLHEEFRRRVKTQAAQPNDSTVVRLFYALYASGQIRLRRIDGWADLRDVLARWAPDRLTTAA